MKRLFIIPLATILFCCCNNANSEKIPQQSQTEQQQTVTVPDGWTTYRIGNSFEISIPPTMELRDTSTLTGKFFTEGKKSIHALVTGENNPRTSIVFQQKGLNKPTDKKDFEKHCRIIIHLEKGNDNEFDKATLFYSLSKDDTALLREYFFNQPGMDVMKKSLLTGPVFSYVKIGNISAMRIDYTRKGVYQNTKTRVYTYYLQNYNEMAEITISFRENEGWDNDMQQVINTFKWLKIK